MNDHVSSIERRAAIVSVAVLAVAALLAVPLRSWRLGTNETIVAFGNGVVAVALLGAAALAFVRSRATRDASSGVLAIGCATSALPSIVAAFVGDQAHAWLGFVGQGALVVAIGACALAQHGAVGRRALDDARTLRTLAATGVALGLAAIAAVVGLAHALPAIATSNGTTMTNVVVARTLAGAGVVAIGALVATTLLARPRHLWLGIALVACVAGDLAGGQHFVRHFTFAWYVALACALVAPVAVLVAQIREIADAATDAAPRATEPVVTRAARPARDATLGETPAAVPATGVAVSPFARTLSDALATTRAASEPLALLLLDLDLFSDYNARFGSDAGDEALRAVESAIATVCFRTTDAWCRVESDTYAAILRGSDLDDAQSVAENLRESVLRLRIEHVPGTRHDVLTTSIGYAIVEPTTIADARAIADAASRALDRAKLLGGNRIATYDRPREAKLVAV